MKDLIDRQAALNCFHGWIDKHGDFNAPDDMPEYRAIEALPFAEPEQRWIPCSERLPDDVPYGFPYPEVIFSDKEGDVGCGYFDHVVNCWYTGGGYFLENVIAWMPFPEPYQEEQE